MHMIELLNITNSKMRDQELRRSAEIRRMQHPDPPRAEAGTDSTELVIRAAGAQDHAALRRLAQLDGKPRPQTADLLVAEVDGEVLAALPLDGGATIADPFRPTAELIDLLCMRAGQLRCAEAEGGRLKRAWRALRGAASGPVMAPMAGDVPVPLRHDGE